MKMNANLLRPVLAGMFACTSAAAQADIAVYTDQTAFLAAVSLPGTDNFDDLRPELLPSPLTRSAGPHGYQLSAGPSDGGFYAAGTTGDAWIAPTNAADAMRFSQFSPNVYAFGGNFFGTGVYGSLDAGRTVALTARAGGLSHNATLSDTTASSFLGFVSTAPLTDVSVASQDDTGLVYWATANNVVLAVPEPSVYAMLLAGFSVMWMRGRRRRPQGTPSSRSDCCPISPANTDPKEN